MDALGLGNVEAGASDVENAVGRVPCGPAHGIAALIVLLVVVALMAWLAVVQIDGQTGDVLGAVEQVSEIAILLVALH